MIWSDDEMGSDIPSTISTLSDDVMYHFYLLGIGGDNMTFMVVVIQR